nr:immunoglobulin light chain junction region [Macaca mulatta]MOW67361.1 immunoglobulin light chain junction region [Macaca mulatta]MOW68071.1 immunoglobulin light chain junction region [Macaca mulatta]
DYYCQVWESSSKFVLF